MDIHFKKHTGLTFWYNTALVSFGLIAFAVTATVMNSGISTGEVTKDVVEGAVKNTSNNLQVIGKMTGTADITKDKVTATATPISTIANETVSVNAQYVNVTYKLIKVESHTITYENIYAGSLYEKSYNSLKDALIAAKEKGLIKINPKVDQQKPDTTTAFLYWIINQNYDENIQNDEIASLVLVYADKDRPSTDEYLQIQMVGKDRVLLTIEKTIPDISSSILVFGGKVKDKQN